MIKRLFAYLPATRNRLGAAIAFAGLGGIVLILEVSSVASITSQAFIEGKPLGILLSAMWLLLAWIGLRMFFQWLSEYFALQATVQLKSNLRLRMLQKVVELGPQYTVGERSGELVSTLCEGIEQMEAYVAKYIPQKVLSVLLPGVVLCAVASSDWFTAAILVTTLPLLVLFMILVGVAAKKKADRQFHALGLLSGHFFDVLRALPTLILFNRSKEQSSIIRRVSEQLRVTTMSTLRVAFLSALIMEWFATLSTAVVAVFLGLRLVSGNIEFYKAFYLLLLIPEFYAPLRNLGAQYHAGIIGITAAERIFDVLDTKPLGWPESDESKTLPFDHQGYRITFDNVTLQYPNTPIPTLSNVSFTLEPGESLAIIGPSGAGKSTVLRLLQGFIRPTSGRILIDVIDMSELSMTWWRSQLAICEQRVHLFHGTVADNLKLGNPDAGHDEVVQAACLANADTFIQELPQGYGTELSEQVRLSGGQIQRIAIARMLLKQAPLLLLDEPTAQLDMENAELVNQALRKWGAVRMTVQVTHRMDTVREVDRILLLEDGKVSAFGSHYSLLAANKTYASMMTANGREQDHRPDSESREGVAG